MASDAFPTLDAWQAAAFSACGVGLCVLDRDLRIVHANDALRELLGRPEHLPPRFCCQALLGHEGLGHGCPAQATLADGREHRYEPTVPDEVQHVVLGPDVRLEGYDLNEAVHAPASIVEVTLHWHALGTPDKNYHTFVHLLDAEGDIVVQHDGPPGEGELPTLGWLPGEYLTDRHRLQLPFVLSDGDYRLSVGLYDPATGLRLGEEVLLDLAIQVSARQGCKCR